MYLRSILQLPATDPLFPLLLREIQQLEIAPVVEGPRPVARQHEEHEGAAWEGNKVQREQHDEFQNLSQGERRIDGALGGLAESLDDVVALRV